MSMTPEEALMLSIGVTNTLVKSVPKTQKWLGVTTTAISDGDDTNPIEINGVEVTAVPGDIVQYGTTEFKFSSDEVWQTYATDITVDGTRMIFN